MLHEVYFHSAAYKHLVPPGPVPSRKEQQAPRACRPGPHPVEEMQRRCFLRDDDGDDDGAAHIRQAGWEATC